MAQIILALVTPRAGEWNHRYIIPTGCGWNDTQLGEALQKVEACQGSRFGMCVSAIVHQQGGREGTEKLFFYCEDFEYLSSDLQKKSREKLELWFQNQRESLIQNVNWSSEGQKQAIPRAELCGLRHDLINLTASASRPAEEPEKKKNSCCLGGGCLMLAVVLGIAMAFTPGKWIHNNFTEPINEFTQENTVEPTMKHTANQSVDQAPQEEDLTPYYDLFVWPEGSEKNLQEAFDILWEARGKESRSNLSDYTKGNEEIDDLLKDKESEKPWFLPIKRDTNNPENWKVLQGIEPLKFHTFIVQLKDMGWSHDKILKEFKPMKKKYDTRFYYANEWEYAEWWRDFLVEATEKNITFSKEETTILKDVAERIFSEGKIVQLSIQNNIAQKLKDSKKLDDDTALNEAVSIITHLKELLTADSSWSSESTTP